MENALRGAWARSYIVGCPMAPHTVLVVSARRRRRSALAHVLAGRGYRVGQAENGLEALLICALETVTTIVVEPTPAGLTPAQLAAAVARTLPEVAIVVASDADSDEAVAAAVDRTIAAPARKPVATQKAGTVYSNPHFG